MDITELLAMACVWSWYRRHPMGYMSVESISDADKAAWAFIEALPDAAYAVARDVYQAERQGLA